MTHYDYKPCVNLCLFWTGITAVVCWASGASNVYLFGGIAMTLLGYFGMPEKKTKDTEYVKSYPGWEQERVL